MASEGNGAGHGFDVRPVVVADNCVRGHTASTQGATEEGCSIGAVPLVLQQNIYDSPMLIDGAIEVAFVFAAEAEYFIHVPPPAHPSAVIAENRGQLRSKGLHLMEHGAR